MADSKLIDLVEDTAPTVDDLVYVVNDPAGVPGDKKVTLSNLLAGMLGIRSEPPAGGYTISNIYMNASLEVVIVYNDVAVE